MQWCLLSVAALARQDLGLEVSVQRAAAFVRTGMGARGCRIDVGGGTAVTTAVAGHDPSVPEPEAADVVLTTTPLLVDGTWWGEMTVVDGSPSSVRGIDQLSSSVAASLARVELSDRHHLQAAASELFAYGAEMHGELTEEHARRVRSLLHAVPGVHRAEVSVGGPVPFLRSDDAIVAPVGSTLTGMEIAVSFVPNESIRLGSRAVVRRFLRILAITRSREERLMQLGAEVDWDIVTKTGNARRATRSLYAAIAQAERFRDPVSVLLCDLDDFARVNAADGRDAGDALLRRFALMVESITRVYDSIARVAGDTFVVVLPGTDKSDAIEVGERIRRCARERGQQASGQMHSTVSIGVAAFPVDGDEPDAVWAAASLAAKRAKFNGRDRVQI